MYTYGLKIKNIYDGDTLTGTVDLGFDIRMDIKVRLARINTPEIRTRNAEEKKRGYEARDFLKSFCKKHEGKIKLRTQKKGKYGRWVSEIVVLVEDLATPELVEKAVYCINSQVFCEYLCVNDLMVFEGYAEYKDY